MSDAGFFHNAEMIVPYHQVTAVFKHPPDRLEVTLMAGSATILGDDCKTFLKGYLAWLQPAAQ
jgi:hypothetical protein